MTTALGRRSPATRSAGYHWAVRLVSRWTAYYTRDLDSLLAAERRDELASDLWEHGVASEARGASGAATGASILWRAARGIPADLSWRHGKAAGAGATHPGRWGARGWSGRGSALTAVLLASGILAFGLFAVSRVGLNVLRGLQIPQGTVVGPAALSVALLVCGLVLLVRLRTRWLGAVWLAILAPATLSFGANALLHVSATFQWFRDGTVAFGPSWAPIPVVVALGALGMFYLTLAIAWLPKSTQTPTPAQEIAR